MTTARYDIWASAREKAEINECGLKILRDGESSLMMWRPKAIRPFANYKFKNIEQRETYIIEQIRCFLEDKERKMKWKIEREGTQEDLDKVKIGDIFHNSWGYDQTNCEFYQIIEKNGKMVKIREIAQKSVEGSEGYMSDTRLPVKDSFIDGAPILTKKVSFYNGQPSLSMPYGGCSLWDGKPKYSSWYA